MAKIFLYRGDQINDKTMPGKYRSLGIVRRFINGGESAYIKREGLLKSIISQINPETDLEKNFMKNRSLFLFQVIKIEQSILALIICLLRNVIRIS